MRCRSSRPRVSQVRGFFIAFKHVLYQISLEATSLLRIPDSRRGVPHSIGRVEPDPPSPAYRWDTEDPQLRERILAGFRKAEALWKTVLRYHVDVELPGFFEQPWKHFDLPSELTVSGLEGKEDDDQADEVLLDSQDADDAAELMDRLISRHAEQLGGAAVTPADADLALQRALGPLFREFNGALSEESYMRKHRFRTNGLLRDGQERSTSILKEDGSIVAVFERDDGTLYWLPGHIEELRVSKNDFDDTRICDDDLQVAPSTQTARCRPSSSRHVWSVRSAWTSGTCPRLPWTIAAPYFSCGGMSRWIRAGRTSTVIRTRGAWAIAARATTTASPFAGCRIIKCCSRWRCLRGLTPPAKCTGCTRQI